MGSLSVNTDGSASLRTTLMGVTDVGTAEKHEAAARPTRCGQGQAVCGAQEGDCRVGQSTGADVAGSIATAPESSALKAGGGKSVLVSGDAP